MKTVLKSIWKVVVWLGIALTLLPAIEATHEMGHFIAGKKLGMKIKRVTLGPDCVKNEILSGTMFGVPYSIKSLPLSGRVEVDSGEELVEDMNMSKFQKLCFVGGGVIATILLGTLLVVVRKALGIGFYDGVFGFCLSAFSWLLIFHGMLTLIAGGRADGGIIRNILFKHAVTRHAYSVIILAISLSIGFWFVRNLPNI